MLRAVSNAPARALYHTAGYSERERLPGIYEDGGDGLRLEKWLDGTVDHTAPITDAQRNAQKLLTV